MCTQNTLVKLCITLYNSALSISPIILLSFSHSLTYDIGGDFASSSSSFTFHSGLFPEIPVLIPGFSLPTDDTEPEFTEGFVLYVEVDESRLDSRDVGRISIVNSVVLVSISDDDRE